MFKRAKKTEAAPERDPIEAMIVAAFIASPNATAILDDDGRAVRLNASAEGLLDGKLVVGAPIGTLGDITLAEGAARVSIAGRPLDVRLRKIDGGWAVALLAAADNAASKAQMGQFQTAARDVQVKLSALTDSMQHVLGASSEQADSARTVGSGIGEVSDTFEVVAAAAQELDASIAEITRQATQSSTEAEAAVERTEAANVTVRQLAESSERIGEVVGLIEEIAAQTNLLALNATIEAARAGEAGRGFAVVAAEVKNLAQQTTKATGDITQQISTIQSTMRDAVEAIDGINSTIKQISSVSTSIAGAVGQQSSATADISRNVLLAAESMRTLGDSVAAISARTERTPEEIDQAIRTAREVADINGSIVSQVESLLASIDRAA